MIEHLTKEKLIEYGFTNDNIERLFNILEWSDYECFTINDNGTFYACNTDNLIYKGIEAKRKYYFKNENQLTFPIDSFELMKEYFEIKKKIKLSKGISESRFIDVQIEEIEKELKLDNEVIKKSDTLNLIISEKEQYLDWLKKYKFNNFNAVFNRATERKGFLTLNNWADRIRKSRLELEFNNWLKIRFTDIPYNECCTYENFILFIELENDRKLEIELNYEKKKFKDLPKQFQEQKIKEIFSKNENDLSAFEIELKINNQSNNTKNPPKEIEKGKDKTKVLWFQVGLLFANGEMNKLKIEHSSNASAIARHLANKSLRPFISESMINTNKKDKNIFSNIKNMEFIIQHCNDNNITVIDEFLEKYNELKAKEI